MQLTLSNGEVIATTSNYDSGTFCGFNSKIFRDEVSLQSRTLDEVLTKEEIKKIEMTILFTIYSMLEKKNE